jgi:gliding motility-associated lipoprotein GldB
MVLFAILFLGVSCNEASEKEQEIQNIPVSLLVHRFDEKIFQAGQQDFPLLKEEYPYLFSKQIPDSVWRQRLSDPLQKELLAEVNKKFSDFSGVEYELENFFKHMKYYISDFQVPEILTLTNDVDYRNNLIVTDSLVLIALDNYLGAEHKYYENIPRYLASNMKPDMIVSDLAQNYALRYVEQLNPRTFLDEMILQGKQLYFKDLMLPSTSDALKIGYSEEQLLWARKNESSIWSYFVENELLYSTDSKLNSRFINPAPYSKFYLEIDNESPGRLGVYMGWQIVRAYANRSGKGLDAVMRTPAEVVFKESKFKPKK